MKLKDDNIKSSFLNDKIIISKNDDVKSSFLNDKIIILRNDNIKLYI